MKNSYLLLAAMFGGALLTTAHASELDSDDTSSQEEPIETITVVANRQPRNISQVASSVTIIDQDTIKQNITLSLEDLVRYQPAIEVDNNSTRFGSSGFRIRGIGGNRTLTVIDNIPVADNFSVGSFSDSGRGLAELNLVNNIEVLRGPASTLYGSRALGGVVAIKLLDADDLLGDLNGNNRLNLAYNSDSNRFATTLSGAFATNNTETLISAAYQKSDETEPAYLPANTTTDPQDKDSQALLFRTSYLSDYGQFRLTLNRQIENRDTGVNSLLGSGRLLNTTTLNADDKQEQDRFVIDHSFEELGFIDRGNWRLWHQQTETHQYSYEERLTAPTPVSLWRNFDYQHKSTGLGADFETAFHWGDVKHRLGYGFEFINNRVSDLRNAEQTNLATSETTNVLLGETFPLRDFPKTNVNEYGLYLHDEISLLDGRLVLSPGIRFEHYSLKPGKDELFEQRYPDSNQTALITNYWLPKLGALYSISDQSEWFFQYAKGYRSPPFSDVNVGLYYPQFNVLAISNPELKSEKGQTFETGLRWRGRDTQLEVAVFHNRYKDFIQSRAPLGFDPQSGNLLFQSINRDQVTIEGAGLQLNHYWSNNFATNLNLAWFRGEDKNTKQPVASTTPPAAVLELAYYAESSLWNTRLLGTFSKSQRYIEDNGDELFSAPGYSRWDLLTQWQIADSMDINLALFNLTDKNYWESNSVLGFEPDNPTLPLLAEAGFSAAVSFNYSF